jgi:hypothetical protein
LFLHFQFPDETENIQSPSAKEKERLSLNWYSISVNKINNSATSCKNFRRSRIEFSQFHQETEKKYNKNPLDPVNPVD